MQRTRRYYGGVLGLVAAGLLTTMVWWTDHGRVPAGQDAVRGVTVHAHTSQAPLSIHTTGAKWDNRPVYRLKNLSSKPLSHLQLFSWSNETLPIVWVASNPPANFSSIHSVVLPPVTVPPGQSAWFELGASPVKPITVEWTANQTATYEAVRIAK